MMTSYLVYWKPKEASGISSGQVHNRFCSAQHSKMGVKVGDTLFAVTVPDPGELALLLVLPVQEVIHDSKEVTNLFGKGPKNSEKWEAAIGPTATPAKFERIDISHLRAQLRFAVMPGKSDRLPDNFTGSHLQTFRRLTDESATLLLKEWARRTARA